VRLPGKRKLSSLLKSKLEKNEETNVNIICSLIKALRGENVPERLRKKRGKRIERAENWGEGCSPHILRGPGGSRRSLPIKGWGLVSQDESGEGRGGKLMETRVREKHFLGK